MKALQNGLAAAIVAIGAAVGYALGLYSIEIFLTLIGVAGFGGLAGLRSAIDSSGFKTYIIAASGALLAIGTGAGLVDPEIAASLMAVLGIGSLPTQKHGIDKAKLVK